MISLHVEPSETRLHLIVDGKAPQLLTPGTELDFRSSLSVSADSPVEAFEWTAWFYPPGSRVPQGIQRDFAYRLAETDWVDPCDNLSRSEHELSCQNESEVFEFDGRRHRSHLNRMAFDVSIDPKNVGVLIRRVYDRFHGRQRARVLVDDVAVGYWYAPIEDRANRWGEDEFFIPAAFTSGKSQLRIQIDPSAGTPLWDVSEYRIYSVLDSVADCEPAPDSRD